LSPHIPREIESAEHPPAQAGKTVHVLADDEQGHVHATIAQQTYRFHRFINALGAMQSANDTDAESIVRDSRKQLGRYSHAIVDQLYRHVARQRSAHRLIDCYHSVDLMAHEPPQPSRNAPRASPSLQRAHVNNEWHTQNALRK